MTVAPVEPLKVDQPTVDPDEWFEEDDEPTGVPA